MAFSYTQKRAHQRYAIDKVQAPSVRSFRHLSKLLFVFSMVLTLASYWHSFSDLFTFHSSPAIKLFGAIVVLLGYFGLTRGFRNLDRNYSPLFDAYKPFELITTGAYATIRHPIYTFNLCVSFGLALSSGLYLILVAAVTGLIFVLRAMLLEEAYLKAEFDEYADYCNRTWRLIPFIW